MKRWFACLLLGWGLAAGADERVNACYNYGCLASAEIAYGERQLLEIRQLLALAKSPEGERALLAQALGLMYAWAGAQSPVHNDRGGNYDDAGVDGRMDCIDHSTTTTRLLRLLERRRYLRWHRVLEPARRVRGLIFQHFSAVIERLPVPGSAADGKPERFAVDTWFNDNGSPAAILPLASWLQGEGPDVE